MCVLKLHLKCICDTLNNSRNNLNRPYIKILPNRYDAESCLLANEKFVKGYGRKAAALLELERFDEAEEVADQGLKLDKKNELLRG